MLHTKFRGNRPTGSGEEDFLVVFTIYGRGGHLGHVTWISTRSAKRFQRRRSLKLWTTTDGRTTDGRTPDHGHPISSPCEPSAQVS